MPARIVLTVDPDPGQETGDDGPALQGAVLGAIGRREPELAAALHSPAYRIRPYSLTTTRSEHEDVRIEIGVLEDALVKPIVTAFEDVDELTTHRGQRRYRLVRGDIYPVSYPDLVEQTPDADTWDVELLSPFVMRATIPGHKQRRNQVLPDPALFLPRLERVLNRFAGDVLPEPIDIWIGLVAVKSIEEIHTRRHLVETEPRRITYAGSVGRFTLGLLSPTPAKTRSLGILLSLANYAGLGDRTTIGMGHTRCTPRPRRTNSTHRRART